MDMHTTSLTTLRDQEIVLGEFLNVLIFKGIIAKTFHIQITNQRLLLQPTKTLALALGPLGVLAQHLMKQDRLQEHEIKNVLNVQQSTYGINKNIVLIELVDGKSFKVGTNQVQEMVNAFKKAQNAA